MDIKIKYKAFIGEKHPDIAHKLLDSDIEAFAVEFGKYLTEAKNITRGQKTNEGILRKCIFKEYGSKGAGVKLGIIDIIEPYRDTDENGAIFVKRIEEVCRKKGYILKHYDDCDDLKFDYKIIVKKI